MLARCLVVAVLFSVMVPAVVSAQTTGATAAAIVNNKAITRDDVDRLVRAALHGRTVAGEALTMLQARMLAQAVDRQLIIDHLTRLSQFMDAAAVDEIVKTMKLETSVKGISWEQYLAQTGMGEDALRAEIAWKGSWENYTKREITTKMLDAYFKKHRRELDDTKLRVSHILLRPARSGDATVAAELLAQAKTLREKINNGEITFAEAVEKYSAGPSRLHGGELGFIPRHGRMSEEFSRAAFALPKDELSPPVVTSAGVHLLKWTEEEIGLKTMEDVIEPVRAGVAQDLFDELAGKERPNAKVEYTGAYPYLKPGTHELVTP